MANLDWELLDSEYLFKDNWLTARKDRCRMPEGKIVDPYYVLEYPDWVNALAITEKGEILMIRQYRHAYGKTIVEIPGGSMDPADDSPRTAMQRELLEETGYLFEVFDYLGSISPNPSTNNNLTHMFIAKGGRKVREQQLDHNEEIEVLLMTPDEVMKLLEENKIVQSLHVTNLFYAFLQLGWLTRQALLPL